MRCPFAVWKPITTNFGPALNTIFGLVVHVQEGNNSLQGFFSNPASQVSSHFWISKTGVLEQYVDTLDEAWAQAAGNSSYLSVETEGYDTEPLTAAQEDMLASLFDWISQTWVIPLQLVDHGGKGMTTHAFYPSGIPDPAWGGHPCPGVLRSGQLPAVIQQIIQPKPEENEVKFVYASDGQPTFVQSGDLVWQVTDATPYISAGFVVVRVSATDISKITAIAKAQGTSA